MKSFAGLYPRIVAPENLALAARRAARHNRRTPAASLFELEREKQLADLHRELVRKTYRPGPYRTFQVRDPVPRTISAAPYRDRVVHHAICQVIEPLFERRFIHHSYANRVGKGTHKALEAFTRHVHCSRYVLRADIRLFFPSIDHERLRMKLGRVIRCRDTLDLVRLIVTSSDCPRSPPTYFPGDDLFTPGRRGCGLPIGNLTSQFFANLYLDNLDHCIKEELRVRKYVRYMDDMALFADEKAPLWEWREAIEVHLATDRLRLHPRKTRLYQTREGAEFVGFRVFPSYTRVRRRAVHRFRRRLRAQQRLYATGRLTGQDLRQSIGSWLAHAAHGDTWRLREALLGDAVFVRG